MSNDISSMYTKEANQKFGRRGFGQWKSEKNTEISPAAYGSYVSKRKRRRHK